MRRGKGSCMQAGCRQVRGQRSQLSHTESKTLYSKTPHAFHRPVNQKMLSYNGSLYSVTLSRGRGITLPMYSNHIALSRENKISRQTLSSRTSFIGLLELVVKHAVLVLDGIILHVLLDHVFSLCMLCYSLHELDSTYTTPYNICRRRGKNGRNQTQA